jgi:transcriptional regulator GlxA family with amidase domain
LPVANTPEMEEIVNYIQANYQKPLQLSTMTERFNRSERSFCRIFKKNLNTTFLQYLKTVRVINAIELLVKTNMSIYEIANAVGYESLSAFSTIFLEYTHKRPQEMRHHLIK